MIFLISDVLFGRIKYFNLILMFVKFFSWETEFQELLFAYKE